VGQKLKELNKERGGRGRKGKVQEDKGVSSDKGWPIEITGRNQPPLASGSAGKLIGTKRAAKKKNVSPWAGSTGAIVEKRKKSGGVAGKWVELEA